MYSVHAHSCGCVIERECKLFNDGKEELADSGKSSRDFKVKYMSCRNNML